jgi:hypothetical protein
MMLTAQEIYQNQVLHLPLAERLRLTALLLDDLQGVPSLLPSSLALDTVRPRPKRGSGRNDISYMADDFDAPLEDTTYSSVSSPLPF